MPESRDRHGEDSRTFVDPVQCLALLAPLVRPSPCEARELRTQHSVLPRRAARLLRVGQDLRDRALDVLLHGVVVYSGRERLTSVHSSVDSAGKQC